MAGGNTSKRVFPADIFAEDNDKWSWSLPTSNAKCPTGGTNYTALRKAAENESDSNSGSGGDSLLRSDSNSVKRSFRKRGSSSNSDGNQLEDVSSSSGPSGALPHERVLLSMYDDDARSASPSAYEKKDLAFASSFHKEFGPLPSRSRESSPFSSFENKVSKPNISEKEVNQRSSKDASKSPCRSSKADSRKPRSKRSRSGSRDRKILRRSRSRSRSRGRHTKSPVKERRRSRSRDRYPEKDKVQVRTSNLVVPSDPVSRGPLQQVIQQRRRPSATKRSRSRESRRSRSRDSRQRSRSRSRDQRRSKSRSHDRKRSKSHSRDQRRSRSRSKDRRRSRSTGRDYRSRSRSYDRHHRSHKRSSSREKYRRKHYSRSRSRSRDRSKGRSGGAMTPQMALQQTMAAMSAKAQALTGIALPKYYNPAAVNPLKYAEQVQKRKLLWQSTEKVEEQPKNSVWDKLTFAQDQDGKLTAKFRKLMGIKSEVKEPPKEEDKESVLKKQEELFRDLDQQYEMARMTTHTQRGVGLGYSAQAPLFPPVQKQ